MVQNVSWQAISNSKSPQRNLDKRVQRLSELGVLKWLPESEWASHSFIIPKQNQTVQLVNDFREVNKQVVETHFQ